MVITGRGAAGYLIDCDRGKRCRSFVVETLEMVTRCPSCGQRETLVDLTSNFFFLQRTSRIAREAKAGRLQAAQRGKAANDHEFMRRQAKRAS